jgi:predicted O-linked N-acetylglucosamine transferase (SPINDLY family)
MDILRQVEGSVLWLLEDSPVGPANLKREAALRGISPERLIFARRMPAPEHLSRQRLADLFLDTWPYNAHTTASDALWVGLPVLTCDGEAFAARVAASLLNAVGLSELIAMTPADYERLAVSLALDAAALTALKQQLNDNRAGLPLFDTAVFTKHIESAYEKIVMRLRAGATPEHIYVDP